MGSEADSFEKEQWIYPVAVLRDISWIIHDFCEKIGENLAGGPSEVPDFLNGRNHGWYHGRRLPTLGRSPGGASFPGRVGTRWR